MRQLKRLFIKIVYPLARLYWWLVRPKTRGVKCLVVFQGKMLLTRFNYAHRRWTVPGGGVHSSETYGEAAKREIFEELNIQNIEPVLIGTYTQIIEYKQDSVEVYAAEAETADFKIDGVEIAEAGWFTAQNLPHDRTPQTNNIIAMYEKHVRAKIS
jgi:ADP-ribose pyrophosphatase YjhB (NUDIX family)